MTVPLDDEAKVNLQAYEEGRASLPADAAGREAEERALMARLSDLISADQFKGLSVILGDPERRMIPLGVPDNPVATALVQRINALRDAAHDEQQLNWLKAAALKYSSPLTIVALEGRQLSRGAHVARLIRTPRGENTLFIAAGDFSAETIALGLRALDLSRLEHGEIPQQRVTFHVTRRAPMSPGARRRMAEATDFANRLSEAPRLKQPGRGVTRTVSVTVGPVRPD